jgi:hypothetical protein
MHDELLRRFRELDPVTGPDRLVDLGGPDWPADPVLRAVLEQAATTNHRPTTARLVPERDPVTKERPMATLTPPRNDDSARPEPRSRRGWLLNAAAVVAVILAVGLIVRFGPLDDDAIAPATDPEIGVEIDADMKPEVDAEHTTPDQALEIAQAYIDARNSHDADWARELVADNFKTSEVPDAFTLETMELAFAVHEAYGNHFSGGDCEVAGPDSRYTQIEGQVVVSCDYLWTDERQRITGYPGVPVGFVFRIEDGLIASIAHDWNPDEFLPKVYNPWLEFLGENHPQFRELALATHGLHPARTRTFAEQAPEYLALYEQWVQEQAD